MIRFDCDWCRATKTSDEVWILGFAAEAVGVTAARREITIMPAWNRETAVHPLAVHFCSEECKNDYMARLFQEKPELSEEVVIRTTAKTAGHKTKAASRSRHGSRKRNRAA